MKVLCNLTTKKIEAFKRWGDFTFNPATHIVLTVSEMPNMELDRLNDTSDGIRSETPDEAATRIESERVNAITDKANAHVLSKYSELKQRKYMSTAIALDDKQYRLGLTLTGDELALLQEIRNVNTWITSVRDVENTAIENKTPSDNVIFPE